VPTARARARRSLLAPSALLGLWGPSAVAAQPCADFCTGDCDGDGVVAVAELVAAVAVALGGTALDACAPGDRDGDARITVDELLGAVARALRGCHPGIAAPAGGLAERPLPD
jgi:hypothetical protein